MYLTKKHLSRRTVLKGAGVTLGLPLLDAMIPAATALAQTAAAPKLRAGFFYIPHGAIMGNTPFGTEMDHWTPSGAGADFKLSPILEPLEKHKRYVTSFGNLENKANAGLRARLVPATWLSGMRPDSSATGASMATTLDQVIAQQDRPGDRAAFARGGVGDDDAGRRVPAGGGCYYSTTLSFRDAHSPLPMEYNPRKVFVQLFGEGDTPEERDAIARQTQQPARPDHRPHERAAERARPERPRSARRLSRTVREIERRVAKAEQRDLSGVTLPEAPIGELRRTSTSR